MTETRTTPEPTTKTYTDQQAIDTAATLLFRKLRRTHPAAYADLIKKLPDGAVKALGSAERRSDLLRQHAERDGITYEYPDPFKDAESEDETD